MKRPSGFPRAPGLLCAIRFATGNRSKNKEIRLQLMTEVRPSGFRVEGERICRPGRRALGIRNVEGTVALPFAGTKKLRATVLDKNDYARDSPVTALATAGGGLSAQGIPDAVYSVLHR